MEAAKLSSIQVAVRVRPFTAAERAMLAAPAPDVPFLSDGLFSSPLGLQLTPPPGYLGAKHGQIRKLLDVVDDKMLIFDPPETNPLNVMLRQAFGCGASNPRIREHRFVFDTLFDEHCGQEEVYARTTRPLLDLILDGYNATVFAYGATGCGKTHTILGTPESPGVIFRTMEELFQRIADLNETHEVDVTMLFLEIYNETIRDLLRPETNYHKLGLREDSNQKILVANLLARSPANVAEVMELIVQGNANRTTSPTDANATLLRLHAVLQINVAQQKRTGEAASSQHTFATLLIIDLAGLERAAATKNRGMRLHEGANINKLLLALGNCINALCDPRRRNHIPYRDSKLTRLLKFSLGGNCKTVMIVCVSPLSQHYDETLNTLKYADRAKEIKTKLIRNRHNLDRHVGLYLKMITEQKMEIDSLRQRQNAMAAKATAEASALVSSAIHVLQDGIESLQRALDRLVAPHWTKYFTLAKRKLIIVHRAAVDNVLSEINSSAPQLTELAANCNFVIERMDRLVDELETLYAEANEIDFVLTTLLEHTLSRLREHEGWSDQMTALYQSMLAQIKQGVERTLLVELLVLFDEFVLHLPDYGCLLRAAVQAAVSGNATLIEEALAVLVSPEYKSAIDSVASEYLQRKQLMLAESVTPNQSMSECYFTANDDSVDLLLAPARAKRVDTLGGSPKRTKIHPRDLESDTSMDDAMSTDDLDLSFNPVLESPPLQARNSPVNRRLSLEKPRILNKRAGMKIAM